LAGIIYKRFDKSAWYHASITFLTASNEALVNVPTETPVFAIPTILIQLSCCVKYGFPEYVPFTFPLQEAVSSALIITASIVLAAALLILSLIIASTSTTEYSTSLYERAMSNMNCHCVIVTSPVAGQFLAGVTEYAPVVHSLFPLNKSASPITGTFALTGILFP